MSWNSGMRGFDYATPRPCTLCGQMRSREYFEQREKNRQKRTSESLQLAKKEGRHIGRPRIHDYEEIMRIKSEEKLSIRATADRFNISKGAVVSAMKDYQKRNKLNAIGGEDESKES